ncbi:MAG: O-antigen ligase family protein [Thermodesulfobacteriota bacterium]
MKKPKQPRAAKATTPFQAPAEILSPPPYVGHTSVAPILCTLALLVPLLVLPGLLDNAFNAPKNLLIMLGTSGVLCVYGVRFLLAWEVPISMALTPIILLLLMALNLLSFFYTENLYYTAHAAVLNISCLLLFHFVSLYVDGRRGFWLLAPAAVSGLLVCLESYLQYFGRFILFKWAHEGVMVMGTIGNSNYLGAYLMFPLFALAGLFFLLKERWRLILSASFIFMLGAFLFTRARAAWMGFFLALPVFLMLMKKIHRFSPGAYFRGHRRLVFARGTIAAVVLIGLWAVAPQRFHTMMGYRNVTNSDTLVFRIKKYCPPSLWLFKQNPLFGTGLWSYRNTVYTAQAEINKKDPGFFRDHPEPKPRRVHNEYLEVLNDGGLLGAAALLLFLLIVMRHGWTVIRNPEIELRDRVISATAFSSLVAVMLNAIFFFPFRLNSTMFMTVLMMGLMEGLYLRHNRMIGISKGWKTPLKVVLIPVVVLVLAGILWFTGIRPIMGEIEHLKYKKALGSGKVDAAEKHLLKAIDYDPHNTAYSMWASQLHFYQLRNLGKSDEFISKAIVEFNGDIVLWATYFMKGMLKFNTGSPFEARIAFEKALYYNPNFQEARQKLDEVNRVIKDHDQVLIKFR